LEKPEHFGTTTDQFANDALSVDSDEDYPHVPPNVPDDHSFTEADDESIGNQPVPISDSDFRNKLMDVVEVILSFDSRLKSVVKNFNNRLTSEPETDVDEKLQEKSRIDDKIDGEENEKVHEEPGRKINTEGQRTPGSQQCVPQIRVFDWYNFKNKWNSDKRYAIEVLKGPAKYYQDETKELQDYEKAKKTGNTPVRSPADVQPDVMQPQDVPERIRIVSSPLIALITELDPLGFFLDLTPGVMLRPYRRLARMEDDLMKHLSGLEAKWSVAEREEVEGGARSKVVAENKQPDLKSSGDGTEELTLEVAPAILPTTEKTSPIEVDNAKNKFTNSSDPLTDSIEALRDLRCLKQFFENFIHPTVNRLRDRSARKIKFTDLWYLFPHGAEVFVPSAHESEVRSSSAQSAASSSPYQSVYRVYDQSGGRAPLSRPNQDDDDDDDVPTPSNKSRVDSFHLMCYYIDWTSKSFSPVSHEIEIKPFENERDITSLEVFPVGYHENFESIREQLQERGRKFLKLTTPSHMNYHGRTYKSHPCGGGYTRALTTTSFVESEVMVDFEESPWGWQPNFGLEECPNFPREIAEEWHYAVYNDKEHKKLNYTFAESMFGDNEDAKWLREHAREQDEFLRDWDLYQGSHRREPVRSLKRLDDLILLPSRVMGYSYRDRTFNAFDIDHLQPVVEISEGFEGLELPEGHQRMVEALVKEHFIKKEAYEKHGRSIPGMDIVSGKGKGLIMLLHGFPGVGKTSTAECVAQSTGRPLFPVTCGDLGLEPAGVEESLTYKFRLAAKWNCVMLLDEADIFLARRDAKQDLQRNALVSGKLYC
jgi:hypothetical protein